MLGTGCASNNTQHTSPSQHASLTESTWQLVSFGEDATSVKDDAEITATFSEEGRLAGSAGCNRYFGDYERRGDQLVFSQMGATRMACPPPVMEQETRFLSALDAVEGWQHRGDTLDLLDGSGNRLLLFAASREEQATFTGEVHYRPRIALPPDAVVLVRLLDMSLADAPAQTLAVQTIQTEGRQMPIPFSLNYDASLIEPRYRYAIHAEIRDSEGKLMWTSDTTHPVLTQNAPSDMVSIEVVQVAAESDWTSALVGPIWHLVQLEEGDGTSATPEAGEHYTIMFGADARYNGQADCNRYGGEYEIDDDVELKLDRGLSTLAACPPPSSSAAFLDVLTEVECYAVADGRLTLSGDTGTLVFERAIDFGGMPPQETGQDYAYTCGSQDDPFTFRIRTGPGEIALWLPKLFEGREGGTYRVLGQVRSASGAKFQDGPVTVWTKGLDKALLEVDGETFAGCMRDL